MSLWSLSSSVFTAIYRSNARLRRIALHLWVFAVLPFPLHSLLWALLYFAIYVYEPALLTLSLISIPITASVGLSNFLIPDLELISYCSRARKNWERKKSSEKQLFGHSLRRANLGWNQKMKPQPKLPQPTADNVDMSSQRSLHSSGVGALPRLENHQSFLKTSKAKSIRRPNPRDTTKKAASATQEVPPDPQLGNTAKRSRI